LQWKRTGDNVLATIKDIAQATGFSVTTVSRALNGYDDVSEHTRLIIRKTAEQLNYIPNILARTLVTKKSKTIGLLVSDLKRESSKDNFVFSVLCGVSEYVAKKDYEMILLSTSTSRQKNKNFLQIIQERNLDGVVIQGLKTDDPYLKEAVESSIPTVLIDIPVENKTTGYVTCNQADGIRTAVKYLVRLGHRKIAFMNGHKQAYVCKIRLDAYRSTLKTLNIGYDQSLVCDGDFNEDIAYHAALNFLIYHTDVTAMICASDIMALGVLRAARELEIHIPENLSLIGFDNILLTQYVTPSLTTIAQDPYALGISATTLLLNMLSGNTEEKHVVLPSELIIRDSTGKA
jgi:LacI family transcriptional regulator